MSPRTVLTMIVIAWCAQACTTAPPATMTPDDDTSIIQVDTTRTSAPLQLDTVGRLPIDTARTAP